MHPGDGMATFLPPPDNRFARYTNDDHSAPIWIASILALIFAYLILAIRLLFVKWNLYGLDDVVLVLAHIVGLGMWASLFSALDNGLGKASKLLSATQISSMSRAYFASRIVLFVALVLSKCSAIIFIQNIFSHIKTVQRVGKATIAIIAVWGLAGALIFSVGSSPDHIVGQDFTKPRGNVIRRLKIITVIDIITEVIIILLPILPLLKLQMPWRGRFIVIIAFSFRVPNMATSIMHLVRYSEFVHSGRRGTLIDSPIIWQNLMLSYSFMSATIPALKGFMTKFITGGMGYTAKMNSGGHGSTRHSNSHNNNNNNNYHMLVRTSKAKGKQPSSLPPQDSPESTAFVTSVPSPHEESSSSRTTRRATSETAQDERESVVSHSSQQAILRKDYGAMRV